jgi:hypothetical protein
MKYKFENTCYVLLKTNKINPIAHERFNLVWYPETAMSLLDCVQYVPYIKSIVTENPWLIACYDHKNVRVWSIEYNKKGEWIYPNDQTYGASVNKIMHSILKIRTTIPAMILDGGKEIKKLITSIEKE